MMRKVGFEKSVKKLPGTGDTGDRRKKYPRLGTCCLHGVNLEQPGIPGMFSNFRTIWNLRFTRKRKKRYKGEAGNIPGIPASPVRGNVFAFKIGADLFCAFLFILFSFRRAFLIF